MSKSSLMHVNAIHRGRYAPHALLATATLTLALSACGPKPEEPAAKPAIAAAAPAIAAVCQASASWFTNPNPPPEIAAAETFCDFYQFSWQWFLSQVSPAGASAPNERVFEQNRAFDPNVKSGQCSLPALLGRASAGKLLAARDGKSQGLEDTQADGNALYDQNNNLLYYNLWYSKAMCESTQQGFAPGTFEIKVAWKVLPAADPSYYSMQATLPGASTPVMLGMVGFHLASWTPNHPEMIWASFEHKANAPLCDGSSPASAAGWSFASPDAAACLAANPQPTSGPPNAACDSFKFNTPDAFANPPPPATNTANNICRQFAHGNQPGQSINGNDNAANLLAIQQLNNQLVGANGLLTGLPDSDPMAIWKHYHMIGALWTKAGASSGNLPVPNAQGPADPTSPQRGSLELANMSMETFQQGDTSPIPNCFGCHNFNTATPLNVSHICDNLFGVASGNCVIPPKTAGVATAARAAPDIAEMQ